VRGGEGVTHWMDAHRVVAAPVKDMATYRHGIKTRCRACGGPLDRAGMDLVYCDRCGREYVAWRVRKGRWQLREVPA
jgi:uncharacterized protein (DUF983 family)